MKPSPMTGFRLETNAVHGNRMEIDVVPTEGLVEAAFSPWPGPVGVVLVPLQQSQPRRMSTFRALALARAGRVAYRARAR